MKSSMRKNFLVFIVSCFLISMTVEAKLDSALLNAIAASKPLLSVLSRFGASVHSLLQVLNDNQDSSQQTLLSALSDRFGPSAADSMLQALTQESLSAVLSSSCHACTHIVKELAEQGLRLKLNHEDLVNKAQTLCQQDSLSSPLSLECTVYNDVEDWLIRGNLINPKDTTDFASFFNHPEQFCNAVDLCGRPNISHILNAFPSSDRNGAVFVRLKLAETVSAIPKGSPNWSAFVVQFIRDLSASLAVPAERFELHMNTGDVYAEVLIKSSVNFGDPTPTQIARQMRALLSEFSEASALPASLKQQVNTAFRPDIIPLVIPPTVDRGTYASPVVHNVTGPSCTTLLDQSRSHCGESFQCNPECEATFRSYYTKCLSSTLTKDRYIEVGHQFNEFFRRCDVCSIREIKRIQHECGLTSMKNNFPETCSLHCAKSFLPFYSDCLTAESEGYNSLEKQALTQFVDTCTRCSPERAKAVQEICDTRTNSSRTGPYPQSCTTQCAAVYVPFYQACMDGVDASLVPTGSEDFKGRCVVAANGGVAFAIALHKTMDDIPDLAVFADSIRGEWAAVTDTPVARFKVSEVKPVTIEGNPHTLVEVDGVVLHTESVDDIDARTVLSRLRSQVARPRSPLYRLALMSKLDSLFGVKNLVWGTHFYDKQPQPTNLQLAQLDYERAKEGGADQPTLNFLLSVIRYHKDVSSNVMPQQITEDLASMEYLGAVVKKMDSDKLKFLEAEYMAAFLKIHAQQHIDIDIENAQVDYLRAVNDNAPKQQQAYFQAAVHYMRDVKKGESKAHIFHEYAELQLKRAIAFNASQAEITLANVTVAYMKAVDQGAPAEELKFKAAVVDYMRGVFSHVPHAQVMALEADIEYMEAVYRHRPELFVAERFAIDEYMHAVAERKHQDVLETLAKKVYEAHQKLVNATTTQPHF